MRWHYAGTARGGHAQRAHHSHVYAADRTAGDSDGRYHSDPSVMCRWTRNPMRTLLRIHSRHFVTVVALLMLLIPERVAAQETILYYTTDAIGSVRMVTDSGGAVVARYDYRPFGDPCGTACGPQGSTEKRQFAGVEKDAETSLDYFAARYYANGLGRFTTVDPDHVGGNPFDPQSWNSYAYARNSPLKFTDSTGTEYEVCIYGGAGFSGSCGSVSDQKFSLLSLNPGVGISLWGGAIFAGNKVVGYYNQTSIDPTWATFAMAMDRRARAASPFVSGLAIGTGAIVTGGTALGVATGGLAGVQPFLLPMGGATAAAMSAVQNPALQRALNDIFRWQDRIAGGLAGAVRFTQQTGRLVAGSDHLGKVANSIGRLQNILRNQQLSPSDRALAEAVLNQLKGLKP